MKKINHLIIFCLFTLMAACSNSNTNTPTTTPSITAENTENNTSVSHISQKLNVADFKAKMEELVNEQLIDVRTMEELNETGRIPQALPIDYNGDDFEAKIAGLDKNKPVMVYCKSGGRSGSTCEMLRNMDFKEVYDLQGGITAWISKDMPVEQLEVKN
ncbi:MAG: rhodanese-like domain-containing protein [Chitinophagales bacterium]